MRDLLPLLIASASEDAKEHDFTCLTGYENAVTGVSPCMAKIGVGIGMDTGRASIHPH